MIWGVGTGRCGTKSLAVDLGGIHEPEPRLEGMPLRAAEGQWVDLGAMESILRQRAEMSVPIVVDLEQSYCISAIISIDPDAKFAWVVRDPFATCASFLFGRMYRYAWNPYHRRQARIYGIAAQWAMTVDLLNTEVLGHPDRFAIIPVDQLDAHENKYNADGKLTAAEMRIVERTCMESWNGTRVLMDQLPKWREFL